MQQVAVDAGTAPASRRVAVIPIHNEAPTLAGVLADVDPHVDFFILIDDGSQDESARIARELQRRRHGVWLLRHRHNRGMAPALKTGFFFAARLLDDGLLRPEDIVITLDADGQHPVYEIPLATARMDAEGLDVLLVVRDFALYPRYKVLGNRLLTALARTVSGFPYRDAESGFRFLRARCLPELLPYFTGWRYSCAQEIAIITALRGLRIANDHTVRINYYRPGTTLLDGFAVLVMSLFSWLRVQADWRSSPEHARRHLAGAVVEPPPGVGAGLP
ncbi:MAG TPA: glycosyltransferase family 2 protein [Candidatus Methanoperedens sp.]|nr:glycosyltransferase family 2 protein [Candidatus Methanoperedens sp.]